MLHHFPVSFPYSNYTFPPADLLNQNIRELSGDFLVKLGKVRVTLVSEVFSPKDPTESSYIII